MDQRQYIPGLTAVNVVEITVVRRWCCTGTASHATESDQLSPDSLHGADGAAPGGDAGLFGDILQITKVDAATFDFFREIMIVDLTFH